MENRNNSEEVVPVPTGVKESRFLVRLIIFLIAGSLVLVLGGIGLFLYLSDWQSRNIPAVWMSYKNDYYGYAFRYSPDLVVAPDTYGDKEGEDIGVIVHKLKSNRAGSDPVMRGEILDPINDKWSFKINKPVIETEGKKGNIPGRTCKPGKTNSGIVYYECTYSQYREWDFYIYLNNGPKDYVCLIIQLEPAKSYTESDRLVIKRIINSFAVTGENKVVKYPTKSDLFSYMKVWWCDNKNKLFEEYTNGVKQYSRYSVLSINKVLDTIYLTKPKSFCEIPLNKTPFLPTSVNCPYPDSSQLIDNHALGESTKYAVCGGEMPATAYEDSCDGVTKLLDEQIAEQTLPVGWKYFTKNTGKEVIAIPPGWQVQESPIGSCKPDFVEVRNPKMEVLVTLFGNQMGTEIATTSGTVNLGKFECGSFAKCELVREKRNGDYQYEYFLLLINQPNFVARPNRMTVRFFDELNEAKLLPVIDEMAKSAIFMYENQVN